MHDTSFAVEAHLMGDRDWNGGLLRTMVWTTMVAGVLILLVALLNFFHLLAGSFLTRMREFSIRRVAGASGGSLFVQLFTQSALLVLLAGLLTGVCIEVMAPWLRLEMAGLYLQFDASLLMVQSLEYLAGLLGVCAWVCGIVVWKVRRMQVHAGVTGGVHRGGKRRLRNLLLGVQLFICWVFISLAAALYLQSDKTGRTLFGTLSLEEKEQILSIPMDFSFMNAVQKQDLIHQFKNLSGVEEVLPADINYLGGVSGTGMYTEKDNKGSYVDVNVMRITSGFFRFMHIPMRSGHTPRESSDLVIDEALSHRLGTDIMGKPLYNFDGDAMDPTDSLGIAGTATITKMIRVMMLAPVLVIMSFALAGRKKANPEGKAEKSKITIPWFAFGFIGIICLNSLLQYLTGAETVKDIPLNGAIEYIDTFMLTMAMTALGTDTSLEKFKQAGAKPFLLAGLLYIWLVGGGYLLTQYITPMFE